MKAKLLALTVLVGLSLMPRLHAAMTLGQTRLGNIFFTTETVSIPITGMVGTSVAWTATDYFGETVGSGTVPVSAGAATIQPNLSRRGWFELNLKERSGTSVVSEKTTTFAILTPISIGGMGDSPFGVQTHFAQSTPPAIMPLMARAGIAHFRDEHYWDSIENPRGTYTYSTKFSTFMSEAQVNGLTPLMILDWANRNYDFEGGQFTGPHTEDGRLGYANYSAELLRHYGPQLGFVEVWNEYNAGTFIRGPATADKDLYYYLMLKKTYEVIKAERPDVQVLAGATVPIAHGFFRDIFEQGAMPYLDAVSIHPYRGFAEGVELEIAELRTMIENYNGGEAKPIWASEFSLNVNAPDRLKPGAAYLAKIVALMRIANVERMYYYLMQDDTSFPYRGLLQRTNAPGGPYIPNPAYVAYATSIRQLYGKSPVGRVGGTAGSTYAYKFSGDGDVHVLWANAPTTLRLSTTGALTVTEIMGQESTLSPSGGEVSLPVTSDVVYVKGPVTAIAEAVNPVVADSVSGYRNVQGENGWYYGYAAVAGEAAYHPADFQEMTWGIHQTDNYRWLGTETFHFMSQGNAHPGVAWAVRRWLSDRAGPMRLTGNVSLGAGGDGVGFRIFVDGVEVYNRSVQAGTTLAYDVNAMGVQAGSAIDFAIEQGGNNFFDSTSFTARITHPESWPYPPTVPMALSATSGDLQVALSWTGSTVADYYNVKRSTTQGGPYATIATATTAGYTDATVEDGTTYYYVVSAANAHGESAGSFEVSGLGAIRPTATASAEQPPNETADKAFDGQPSTKWYTGGLAPSHGWLQYYYGGRGTIAKTVIRYDLISASDRANRDPRDWQFQASHDGVNWVTLDTRTGETFATRLLRKQYPITNDTAYQYYRLNILSNNGATDGIQLGELALFDDGPVVSASAQTSPNETADKAFDGLSFTKWYTGGTSRTAWLQYYFGGQGRIAKTVMRYDLTSANDRPGRDPRDWQFQGSHDGVTWVTLDTRAGELFAARHETRQYPVANDTAYEYYRLNILSNNGGADGIQLAELAFTYSTGTALVTLGDLAAIYDGTPKNVTVTTAPAGLPTIVTYDGSTNPPVNAGTYAVVATIDHPDYTGTATGNLIIARAGADVTLGDLEQTYDGSPKVAGVTTVPAGVATTVTYDGSATPPVSAGSYAVVATVVDPNYFGEASGTLIVAPAQATVMLGGLAQVYDGTPKTVAVTTVPAGLVVSIAYDGSLSPPVNAGTYAVVAVVNDPNYVGSAAGTLVIEKATATVSLTRLTQRYDGTPKTVTVTTEPAGLTVNVTYDGVATPPVLPGTYAVVATIDDLNYAGSASATLRIVATGLVRHAPILNGGVDGSLQVVLTGNIALNQHAWISGDLLVRGTPALVASGQATYVGVIDGSGSPSPSNYSVSLNGSSVLRYLMRRVDPIALPTVAAPPLPAGTRDVVLNSAGQSPGNFATLRNLTLNSGVGQIAIPGGTYGDFTANSNSGFSLGVAGATEPTVYHLQSLTLNSRSQLQIVGPVIVTIADDVALSGAAGNAAHPAWLTLRIAFGDLTLNGGATLHGLVTAPSGTVTINGGCTLVGEVNSDYLIINLGGLLDEGMD